MRQTIYELHTVKSLLFVYLKRRALSYLEICVNEMTTQFFLYSKINFLTLPSTYKNIFFRPILNLIQFSPLFHLCAAI